MTIIIKNGFQIWGSCQGLIDGSFFPVERGMVDLLAKACAHAGIKAVGVKTMVTTSAIFAVGLLNLKKKKKKKRGGNMNKWRVCSFSARKSSDVL